MTKILPPEYDPMRRLIAAVVVRALQDYLEAPACLTPEEQSSAGYFLFNETPLIARLVGLPEQRIKEKLVSWPSAGEQPGPAYQRS